ncbi:MAG: universal stress protein [Deltaproteobacteria bacterium]|nr:universal stress protein [Deltaproteobacteria bacterium]
MYQKILVPLDGSKLAECALSHVKNLVKDGAVGEVILLNVSSVNIYRGGEAAGYMDMNSIKEGMSEKSQKYLADVESRLNSEGIKVKTESLEGYRAAETISDYAQNNGVDLIVIASHGYTGMKKLMLGSVALEVLHESHVPVLLIRPESCR